LRLNGHGGILAGLLTVDTIAGFDGLKSALNAKTLIWYAGARPDTTCMNKK
jgi:hypothetical protein